MRATDSTGHDVLAIWNDVDPAHEAEYHRWYWEQHLPERLSIPGFLSAYRYQAVEGSPKFFTWYFVRDIEVLRSPRYLERLGNPTDWTRRIMPSFRNMTRCACRLALDEGRGVGGTVVVARIRAAVEDARKQATRVAHQAASDLLASAGAPGVTRFQLWDTDREISDQRTPEQALRGGPDQLIDCAAVLHCAGPDTARAAAAQLHAALAPILRPTELDGPDLYTLLHSLSAAD
jgi:hypothetical protein